MNFKNINCVWYDMVDIVVKNRPSANRKYDQIYMFATDMLHQAEFIKDYLRKKKVVFLGDGDGMSLLFSLISTLETLDISNITVFDFDERILNNYKKISKQYNTMPINCVRYNVLNPIPNEYEKKYDYFYINPPYGSKNNGNSCIAWLHRCMELCKPQSSGCIIIPYDLSLNWTVINMYHIQEFLLKNGFIINKMIPNIHRYHLEDNPDLKSTTILVDRVRYVEPQYKNKLLPVSYAQNLYGSTKKIPQYILDDTSLYGKEDFDWKYGADNFWSKDD